MGPARTGRLHLAAKKAGQNMTLWSIRVSLPEPPACKAGTLPIELMPQLVCLEWGSNPRGQIAQLILSQPPWTSRASRHGSRRAPRPSSRGGQKKKLKKYKIKWRHSCGSEHIYQWGLRLLRYAADVFHFQVFYGAPTIIVGPLFSASPSNRSRFDFRT